MKKILVFILILALAVSLTRYIWGLKKQVQLLQNEKQNLLQELKKEKEDKERLIQESLVLKGNLAAAQGEVARLKEEVGQNLKVIEQLSARLISVKQETPASKEENAGLAAKMDELKRQKDDLRARLNSISGLKKEIRQLKIQMRNVNRQIKFKSEAVGILEGNRGFLLLEGKPTPAAKLKIEVNPAPARR